MDVASFNLKTNSSRRAFLGTAVGASLVLGGVPAPAAALGSQVDTVTLQVLVDNATFGPFLPDLALPGLKVVRHTGDAGKAVMAQRALNAEFGLSILATSRRGPAVTKVLVDFGYSAETVRNNLMLLGIDPSTIDAAVLSHGHLDHYGGFKGFFGAAVARKIPLYVGGEEVFCERLAMIGNPPPLMGTLDRAALLNAGFEVRFATSPQIIKIQAQTTGTIPLLSFERAAIPLRCDPA